MALKIRETDLLNSYKKATPEKRLSLMLEYYPDFSGMLHKIEKKTEYKIKTEQENMTFRTKTRKDRSEICLWQTRLHLTMKPGPIRIPNF